MDSVKEIKQEMQGVNDIKVDVENSEAKMEIANMKEDKQ